MALVLIVIAAACSRPERIPSGKAAPSATASVQTAGAPTVALVSPYRPKTNVYKGQLHAHTTNSDGTQSPADVMRAYKRAGYHFVAITDHEHITADPKVPGILFIPGVENAHRCLHENRVGARLPALGDRKPQDVIDLARGEGSFVIINHPDWPGVYPADPCWSDEALLAVTGYHAVEVWNASCEPKHNRYEHRIDALLTHGRRTFLTAVDDCHDVHSPYCMTSSVRVYADRLTQTDVIGGLATGNYYSSSGAEIGAVSTDGGAVAVTVPDASGIEFIVRDGKVAHAAAAARDARYAPAADDMYVRIRVTRASDGRMAWSNPIYVAPRPSAP